MRLYYIILTALLAVLITSAPGSAARWDLVLLTTSGLNGQIMPTKEKNDLGNADMVRNFGGFARIQSIFESYRNKYPGITIVVATGDDLMGESLSNKQGKTIFGAMNLMGFDISTLGNHEFDRGSKFLIECLKHKNFPTVISNLNISPNARLNKYIQEYSVIEKNFVKVGFIGMLLPNLKMISNPGSDISVDSDLIKSARTAATKLKKQKKTDIIVLLSHLNIEDQKKILEKVPEIDIICGGHSHKDILPGQEIIARDALSPGLMIQCGDHGRYVGVLKIKLSDGVINKHEWTIIPITDQTKSDEKILEYIKPQTNVAESDKKIATTPFTLDTRVSFIRTQEAPLGKLVSSILRKKFKTDIAFQNSGGIRGDKIIPKGPLSGRDINQMFPFGNTVTILKITGKDLKQLLEHSVHKLPARSGAFLQTAGVQYTLDLSGTPQELEINSIGKPVRIKTPGTRISKIKIIDRSGNFTPISEDRKYSIATNSYLARGGDGYIMLKDINDKVETFIKIRDIIKLGLVDMKQVHIDNAPSILNTEGHPFFN